MPVTRPRAAAATAENTQLTRTNQALQAQVDKLKVAAAEAQSKQESEKAQRTALEKELEQLKRTHKQASSPTSLRAFCDCLQMSTTHSAVEVRLNRAKEEADRLRVQLAVRGCGHMHASRKPEPLWRG